MSCQPKSTTISSFVSHFILGCGQWLISRQQVDEMATCHQTYKYKVKFYILSRFPLIIKLTFLFYGYKMTPDVHSRYGGKSNRVGKESSTQISFDEFEDKGGEAGPQGYWTR